MNKLWRNKAVVDAYEPGSTFKIFTSAMAIEENVISSNDVFYCNGSKHVGNYDIHCWKSGGHGSQTFERAVQNSCNPAFIEIGARVGMSKFYEYMSGLGFREKTGIDLPGEVIGLVAAKENFNEVELATSSFGQGFTVTPIQMITGVNAIANDGMMVRPHIVKRFVDSEGNVVKEFGTEEIRQIVSESTSKQLREVLESVVSEGSGSGAYIKGYRVGGKTGTSEKVPRGNGKYVASFVGIAPCDDPEIVCLVMLDEPMGGAYFGGIIATPVARNIMEETLAYLGIEPSYTAEELATTSEQLLANSNVLSVKTDESMANLSELSRWERVVADNVEKVETTSQNLLDKSRENERLLNDLHAINDEVSESMKATTDIAQKLSDAVQEIGVTLNLISDISSSTNLLALNASIEAARAGEAGRGFAVVATEVGNLANSTQESLKEVKSVIERVQSNVKEITVQVEENSQKLNNQNAYFSNVFKSMQDMTELLNESVNAINTMGDAQSKQSEVIKKTVSINQDIAESIRNENEQFASINAMAENSAKDTAEVTVQASAINDMVDEMSKLLKQEE